MSGRTFKLLVLSILSLQISQARASISVAPHLTLKDAIQIALDKSPDLASLQEQTFSANAKTRGALAPSEPTLSMTSNDLTQAFHLNSAASNFFEITQPIGFPGRAWMSRSQLGDQADSLSFQARAMRLQVMVNVKTAYYSLQLAQKTLSSIMTLVLPMNEFFKLQNVVMNPAPLGKLTFSMRKWLCSPTKMT